MKKVAVILVLGCKYSCLWIARANSSAEITTGRMFLSIKLALYNRRHGLLV